jgi:hypothetical protein
VSAFSIDYTPHSDGTPECERAPYAESLVVLRLEDFASHLKEGGG